MRYHHRTGLVFEKHGLTVTIIGRNIVYHNRHTTTYILYLDEKNGGNSNIYCLPLVRDMHDVLAALTRSMEKKHCVVVY